MNTDGGKGFKCAELLLTDWAGWGGGTGGVGAVILDGNLERGDCTPYSSSLERYGQPHGTHASAQAYVFQVNVLNWSSICIMHQGCVKTQASNRMYEMNGSVHQCIIDITHGPCELTSLNRRHLISFHKWCIRFLRTNTNRTKFQSRKHAFHSASGLL